MLGILYLMEVDTLGLVQEEADIPILEVEGKVVQRSLGDNQQNKAQVAGDTLGLEPQRRRKEEGMLRLVEERSGTNQSC